MDSLDTVDTNLVAIVEKQRQSTVTKKWVGRLFDFLSDTHEWTWRNKIKDSGQTEEGLKEAWFNHLQRYKKSALVRAIKKMEKKEEFATFPPSLSQMSWLCKTRPEDLGLPCAEEAYQLFAHGKQRRSAPVLHANNRITAFNIRKYPIAESRRIFLEAYLSVVDEIEKGDMSLCVIPERPVLPDRAPEFMHKHDDITGHTAHIGRMFKLLGASRKSNQQQGNPA